jgi:hypothetical protein
MRKREPDSISLPSRTSFGPAARLVSWAAYLTRVSVGCRYQFVLEEFARPLLSTSSLSRKRSGVRIPSGLQTRVVIGVSRAAGRDESVVQRPLLVAASRGRFSWAHRCGERESAEHEHPRRRREAGERLRDGREAKRAPCAGHRERDREVRDRLEQPCDRGADQDEKDVSALDIKTRRRRDPPERERHCDGEDRTADARACRARTDVRVRRERARMLQLWGDKGALPSVERVGE